MVDKRKHATEVEKVKKQRNHLTTKVEKIYSPQQKVTYHNNNKKYSPELDFRCEKFT